MAPDLPFEGRNDQMLNRPSLAAEDIASPRRHSHHRPQLGTADAYRRDGLFNTPGKIVDDPVDLQAICDPVDHAIESTFQDHEPAVSTNNYEGALDDEIFNKLANLEERSSEIARFSETLSLDGHENESDQRYHDKADVAVSTASPTLTNMICEMHASADSKSIFVPESIFVSATPVATINEECPYLVHKSNSTEIYRIKDMGIKVLAGETSLEEQNKKLGHEHNVANFLSSLSRKRRVIEKKDFDGRPALWFKWEEGVTLKKWLQQPEVERTSRVRVAMAVAKTLSEFHDGGVFYNNLSLENIVLTTIEGVEVATFIDLSKSGFIDMRPNADKEYTDMLRRTDLKMMGHVFSAIFHGQHSSFNEYHKDENCDKVIFCDNDTGDYQLKKRGKPSYPGDFLPNSNSCLPLYIHSLISVLVSPWSKSSIGYSNAKDVWLDLKSFCENPDGNIKMVQSDQSTVNGSLELGGDMTFYGRQVQLSMIQHFFESVIRNDACPRMSVIYGCPGAG